MWAGVVGWESGEAFGPPPYTVNGVEITRENLWEHVAQLDEIGPEALFIADADQLMTEWASDMVARYVYCQEMHTPAYPGSYDDQPAQWIDAVNIIRREQQAASRYLQKVKHGR